MALWEGRENRRLPLGKKKKRTFVNFNLVSGEGRRHSEAARSMGLRTDCPCLNHGRTTYNVALRKLCVLELINQPLCACFSSVE